MQKRKSNDWFNFINVGLIVAISGAASYGGMIHNEVEHQGEQLISVQKKVDTLIILVTELSTKKEGTENAKYER